MTSVFHKILRAVAGAMEIPDVVFLVLALGFAVFSVGWLICEYFTEHRHMREDLPRLLDALRERGADTALLIRKPTQPAAKGRPARADGASRFQQRAARKSGREPAGAGAEPL